MLPTYSTCSISITTIKKKYKYQQFHSLWVELLVLLYLFSQEAVSMSILCDRDKLWDWVSRLLEGELERELTPSLLWLPYATPAKDKKIGIFGIFG